MLFNNYCRQRNGFLNGYIWQGGRGFLQTEEPPVTFIKEATAANAERTLYIIINENCRYLDKNSPVLVYVNDSEISSGFAVEHLGGAIRLSEPLDEEDEVTVSGKSITVSQSGGFFNWSAELAADTADISTFESSGWKENLPTINGFSAAAESYWADERLSARLDRS